MRISDWSSDVCSSDLGDEVTDFAVGETVGVGCMVDSCQACPSCEEGLEQYCTASGFVGTYNAPTPDAPAHTLDGYAQTIVVSDKLVLKILHSDAQVAAGAPLLVSGITSHSPPRPCRFWEERRF